MEEKEEGISIGEIFHVIFIKKWLLLAITILVALVGVVFVQFLYNPGQEEYRATFQIVFPDAFAVTEGENENTDILGKRYYPDGTEFLYQEFISVNNLKEAQAKDESFASINVEQLRKKNGITIAEYERTTDGKIYKTGIFSIVVAKKFFQSQSQARDFILALIEIPAEKIIEKSKSLDYDRYLKQYALVDDYASQIDILIKQKDLMISEYDRLITEYSTAHSITLANGTKQTISEAQSELESYFTRYDLEAMKNEVETNGYIPAESDFLETVLNLEDKLENEFARNQLKLEGLTNQIKSIGAEGQSVVIQDIITTISALTERNAEIRYTIDNVYKNYKTSYTKEGYAESLAKFDKRINAHYQKLLELTDKYSAFHSEIYEKNTNVLVSSGSIITEKGGLNVFLVLGVSLVAGFVLGCCVNLILDFPKFLKEKKAGKKEQNEEELSTATE